MELEKQVVNIELSKKLKELGFKQDSIWIWLKVNRKYKLEVYRITEALSNEWRFYPAYTVSELGEMLPSSMELPIKLPKTKEHPTAKYSWHAMIGRIDFLAETEADARAKMLIYLLENKLIKL